MSELISRSEFARRAEVSAKSITTACKPGRSLEPACVGKRVDASHPVAIAYVAAHTGRVTPSSTAPVKGWGARNEKRKAEASTLTIEVPEDITEFADMTLRDLMSQFGTDTRFLDWLKATKEIEMINEKRLKNAITKGELVSRELVKSGVIDPIDSAHIKLLTDGAKTITRRTTAMHDAGRSLDEIEKFVVDQISSFIRPMKAKIARTLQNV